MKIQQAVSKPHYKPESPASGSSNQVASLIETTCLRNWLVLKIERNASSIVFQQAAFVSGRASLAFVLAFAFFLASPQLSLGQIQSNEDGSSFVFTHATMSDGVKIGLAVGYPKGYDPADQAKKWPAVLEMSGYPRQTKPASQEGYAGLYITVNASLRGTGASEGSFSYMSERSIKDGHEVIEQWIVKQPWSNGKVGIHGHSWSGLTGFRIAATNPPHLKAVVVSGLFDDAVRGIAVIGGIKNVGFPVKWTSKFQRPDGVFGSDEAAAQNRKLSNSESREIREGRNLPNAQTGETPKTTNSLRPKTYRSLAGDIRASIFILHSYQDHETGPSGVWLFDYLPDDISKRLLISNGHHGMALRFIPQRRAWLDFWLRGERSEVYPDIDDPTSRVQAFFEVENRQVKQNEPLFSSDFPLPETQWTRYYLNSANELSTAPALANDDSKSDTYQVVSDAKDDELDGLKYRLSFEKPTAICGPITLTLWAGCTAVNTDFFAVISDVAPDGRVRPLQRGMLRASLSSLDEEMSDWVNIDGDRVLIRPYHRLSESKELKPGKPYRFEIEIFPVGHVFREGHQLLLSISQPPNSDPVPYPWGRRKKAFIKSGSYKYESKQPDSTVTIHHTKEYPSSVLLPLLPKLPTIAKELPMSIDQLWIKSEIERK